MKEEVFPLHCQIEFEATCSADGDSKSNFKVNAKTCHMATKLFSTRNACVDTYDIPERSNTIAN